MVRPRSVVASIREAAHVDDAPIRDQRSTCDVAACQAQILALANRLETLCRRSAAHASTNDRISALLGETVLGASTSMASSAYAIEIDPLYVDVTPECFRATFGGGSGA
ncbi:MAG: hypothetical protein IIA00_04710 [Proteobacteria bacterium]|nr:hypothetical protein [Pseudomonadota bacterium]